MSIPQAKVAIITVTYNCASFIEDYLTSLSSFIIDSNHRLFLVDNASTDNTCKLITHYTTHNSLSNHIQLVKLKSNIGFGKGCNQGVAAAKEYQPTHFWFLNPDTQALEGSGEALLALLNSQSNVDFAGSLLVNKSLTPRPGAFRFPGLCNIFLSTMRLGILDKIFHKYTTAAPIQSHPYPTDWLTGASFMTKAECFYSLQGFDPYYFLYYEEVDLFYRAKKAGYSAWCCPNSKVFHISGASTGVNNHKQTINRQPSYWFESRRHYYISNYGKAYFIAADTIFLLSHFIWILRAKLQGKPLCTPPHFVRDTLSHGYFKWLQKPQPK